MASRKRVLVLNHKAWNGFLIEKVLKSADRIEVQPFTELSKRKLALIADYDIVVVNADLTDCGSLFSNQNEFRCELERNGVVLLNADWQNIDKLRLQLHLMEKGLPSTLVTRNRPPTEHDIIIKTRKNFGGLPEAGLAQGLDYPTAADLERYSTAYRVVQSDKFDDLCWNDDSEVIENFIHCPEGFFYRVYLSGIAVLIVKAFSDDKIKKVNGDERDRNCFSDRLSLDLVAENPDFGAPIANAVLKFVQSTSVDYCSLDIVTNGEQYYIIDINTTPWAGHGMFPQNVAKYLEDGLFHPEYWPQFL